MAIDNMLHIETDNLALPDKSFYPVRIPVSHWQLRHYISAPEPDHLYYASGHDVYCLNTATKKRRLIAVLPFEARCTASGYGYVCVGGEVDGQNFAAIKVDSESPRTRGVDEPLHVPLGSESEDGTVNRRAASVKVERIGEQIVNSISIHRIHDEAAHLDDIVAVLTNNDKTVRLYSLPANVETKMLDLMFPINHATLSPSGQLLVAVGDHNQAFFFERELQQTPPQIPKPHNRLTSASLRWKLRSVVDLHISGPEGSTGYFTTTWSPSGHLVAVGSEGGYITVFDVNILLDPNVDDSQAAVATVPGSRPDYVPPHPGAIRSMMFAPDPWDLLIWAEDQDRICVGDLRTGLRNRQVITLDPKDESLVKVAYEDILVADESVRSSTGGERHTDELEEDFMRRYREAPNNSAAVNFATEYVEARRRQRQQMQEMAGMRAQMARLERSPSPARQDMPAGLTAREQQILESLRTTRQREEARALAGGQQPAVTYTNADLLRETAAARSNSTTPSTTGDRRSASDIYLSMVQDSLPELSRTSAAGSRPTSSHGNESSSNPPPFRSLQESAWGSYQRVNQSTSSRLPRRRASVIIEPPRADNTSPHTTTTAITTTTTAEPSNTATASTTEEDDENPWRTLERHFGQSLRGQNTDADARTSNEPGVSATAGGQQNSSTDMDPIQARESLRQRALARQHQRWRAVRASHTREAQGALPPPDDPMDESAAALEAARADLMMVGGRSRVLPSGLVFPTAYEATPIRRAQILRTGGFYPNNIGERTAGLAMSADGRSLWAACERGIFEIKLNLKGRLFWPSVEAR